MPSMNRVQTKSMRGVGHKVDFLINKVLGPYPITYIGFADTWLEVVDYSDRLTIKKDEVFRLEGLVNDEKNLLDPALVILKDWEAGYYSTFLTGERLSYFPESDRARIGLSLDNDIIPPRGTEQEIIETGALVIAGDARRITAGSAAMALPSIVNFTSKFTPANLHFNTHSELVIELIAARKAVADMLPEGIILCNKTDKEIEVRFNNADRAAMRHNAEYWGVHYSSSTPISYLALTFLHAITHAPLEHVLLLATPGLEEGETNIEGFDSMNIHTFDAVTVNAILTGFIPSNTVFDTIEGETITRTIFMSPVPPPPPIL